MIDKPHVVFLLAIPITMLMGILSGDAILDINVHDTYYIITYYHLAILISTLFGIIGLGYWIIQKAKIRLSKSLNFIHMGLTFVGPLIVWILTKFYRTEFMEYEFNNNLSMVITLVILLIIFGQIIFPINIIYGLLKTKNKTSV